MEITIEKTGELTATVQLSISSADYSENVNKVLKDYQRKANVPGFRPGHVPAGLIKKMYGSAVVADEVNKVVSEALTNYIRDEKLEILGQPMPNFEKTQTFDWKEEQDIEFYFDLGFSPAFELKLDDSITIDYYNITVTDDMLDKYIADIQQRYGTMGNTEISGEKDVLAGEFTELDDNGDVLEGGIVNLSKLMIDVIRDEELRKLFVGKKVGDQIDFNPAKALGNATEISSMLGIDKADAEAITSDFRLTVKEITTMIPAAMNEEFYNKIFTDGNTTDEGAFRDRIRDESERSFVGDSDHYFMHLAQDKLLEMSPMNLPDEFMKRWLIDSNEGKLTAEELEKNYDKYSKSMKWQLIENRLIKDFDIQVPDEEIKAQVKESYLPGWTTMSLTEDLLKRLDSLADNFLESRPEEARRIIDRLYEQKIAILIKSKVKLKESKISYEEFLKLDAERHQ